MSLKPAFFGAILLAGYFAMAMPVSALSVSEEVAYLLERGDEETAFLRAKNASNLNDAEGHEMLAWFYETGHMVAQDRQTAKALYTKAAEAGRAHAQWRLGVMLDEAMAGEHADPQAAYDWFFAAAQQDYAKAWSSLGVMYATGRGIDSDYDEALACYLRASQLGEAHGFYGVGILFALGQGVTADSNEAAAWLMVALDFGDEQAADSLAQVLALVDPADKAAIAARADAIAAQFGPASIIA